MSDSITEFPPINDELKDILGRPSFSVVRIAECLRRLSLYQIPNKAEAEQAAVIHFMLTMYFKHGSAWRDEGNKIIGKAP
jgi:hypothetical protein